MRNKALLALGLMAGLMTPQTMANPATGQTVQQQMIAQDSRPGDRFEKRKGRNRPKVRIKNDSFLMNQRQKRKRWRQAPHTRPAGNKKS